MKLDIKSVDGCIGIGGGQRYEVKLDVKSVDSCIGIGGGRDVEAPESCFGNVVCFIHGTLRNWSRLLPTPMPWLLSNSAIATPTVSPSNPNFKAESLWALGKKNFFMRPLHYVSMTLEFFFQFPQDSSWFNFASFFISSP